MLAWAIATAAVGEVGAAAVAPAMEAVREATLGLLRRQQPSPPGQQQRSCSGERLPEGQQQQQLSPRELSTIVWSFGRLRLPAPFLADAVGRVALPLLPRFAWGELALLAWGQCERF